MFDVISLKVLQDTLDFKVKGMENFVESRFGFRPYDPLLYKKRWDKVWDIYRMARMGEGATKQVFAEGYDLGYHLGRLHAAVTLQESFPKPEPEPWNGSVY
jgi:hypothetical protein